jgi:hypothetical protein
VDRVSRSRVRLAPWLLLACGGCHYKVVLTSDPPTAEVLLPDGRTVVTPAEVTFDWVPFGHQRITATAPRHRPLEVDLRRTEIRFWRFVGGTLAHPATLTGRPRGEVELLLVPEHGPPGSWDPKEIP